MSFALSMYRAQLRRLTLITTSKGVYLLASEKNAEQIRMRPTLEEQKRNIGAHADAPLVCTCMPGTTDELAFRLSRAPDYAAESQALSALAREMASHP